jgi:hypothetical protein
MEFLTKNAKMFQRLQKYFTPTKTTLSELDIDKNDDEQDQSANIEKEIELYEDPKLYPLQITEVTDFDCNYFMDGVQRSFTLGKVFCDGINKILPLRYCILGAIILHREDKILNVWEEPMIEHRIIAPPKEFLPNEVVESIDKQAMYVNIEDISNKDRSGVDQLMNVYVSKERIRLEGNIISYFNRKKDDWIIIDGPLTEKNFFAAETFLDSTKKIGVIKRHRKQYYSDKVEFRIHKALNLANKSEQNLRTPKFYINRQINGQNIRLVSCYTKLHFMSRDPDFSLIRIETYDQNEELFDNMVDLVRKERFPLSHPSNVWDKKIYPIKMCEQYLNAIIPSIKTIKTVIYGNRSILENL